MGNPAGRKITMPKNKVLIFNVAKESILQATSRASTLLKSPLTYTKSEHSAEESFIGLRPKRNHQ